MPTHVVSVADIDAKDCVDDSLVEILKLNICQEIEGEVLSKLWKEGKFSSRLWSWILVKILRLKFCWYFEAEFRSGFEVEFDQDFEAEVYVEI